MSAGLDAGKEPGAARTTAFFAVAVCLSAFLIFLVQPMVGKRILPWFGGGPGVWSLCLMFYQCSLFVGYAYAHGLISWVRPGVQWIVHGLVVVAAFALLPVLPGEAWMPSPLDDPSDAILGTLVANVALPFIALAATGPLLQAWFSRRFPSRSPYPLYAVSNVGSLAALVLFPSMIEPSWPLAKTGEFWSLAFAVCGTLVLGCGVISRSGREKQGTGTLDAGGDGEVGKNSVFFWLLLPAGAVVLLMAITNKLCLDVASVPFLWVLPLGLYLVSFILTFGPQRAYRRSVYLVLSAGALFLEYAGRNLSGSLGEFLSVLAWLPVQALLYLLLLFSACMLLHGELYRLRPPPQRLTAFYLAISFGGALGGLFVGLLAPRLFSTYSELYGGLAASLLVLLAVLLLDSRSRVYWHGRRRQAWMAVLGTAGMLGFIWLTATQGALVTIHSERNFFGIIHVMTGHFGRLPSRVQSQDSQANLHLLVHGNTLHGAQSLDPAMSDRPLSYYGLATGIGIVLDNRKVGSEFDIGVIGLGTGALAAYGLKGDRFRFYEIDPGMIRVAEDDAFFSFLADSEAEVEVVQGDARLSLEAELDTQGSQEFDLLVVDAFSSDSVPVHLLTREALKLYAEHVSSDGLIAFHASNRYLDLLPVIYGLAADAGLHALTLQNGSVPFSLGHPARWIFLSRDAQRLKTLPAKGGAKVRRLGLPAQTLQYHMPEMGGFEELPVWTDDYSSLLSLLNLLPRKS